jgi:hypothetical protein
MRGAWHERGCRGRSRIGARPAARPVAGQRLAVTAPLAACAALALYFVCTVPLDDAGQLAFATCCLAGALAIRRVNGRYATLVMIALSVVATGRYMFWRLTETRVVAPLDAAWGAARRGRSVCGCVLLLGYFQTAWPLGRKPLPLPASRGLAERRRVHPDVQRAARRRQADGLRGSRARLSGRQAVDPRARRRAPAGVQGSAKPSACTGRSAITTVTRKPAT